MTEQQNIVENYKEEDLLSPILEALKTDSLDEIKELLSDKHTSDIAEILNLCDKEDRIKITAILGDIDPEILPFLDNEAKEQVISLIGTKSGAEAIGKLESDEAIQFVEDLPEEKIEEILENLEDDKRTELQEALNYPEDSAGRLANKQFVVTKKSASVGKVIDLLREDENLPDDFYTIFVVDSKNRPTHFVPLSRIMRNERNVKVSDLMEEVIKAIEVETDQEDVANIFQKYGLISLPVVDKEEKIIGVITIDDVADVIQEEVEEDILRLSGVGAIPDILSSPYKKFRNRSPWLFINLITSVLASLVISMFEVEIQKLVALAVLMPIVAAMSGNVGSQTLTVAVRAIATKDLSFNNFVKVLRKEVITSLINGFIFGFIIFLASFVFYQNAELSFVIFCAVILTFLLAASFGLAAPLAMHKMGIDPAISASALVYAVTDMSSFFIFLGLAGFMLL